MFRQNAIKPAIILSIFLILTCIHFWTTSRYPGLSEKAILSDSPILSNIGFFPIYEIHEDDPFWTKVFKETGNWINTNRKGMTFSFQAGAFFLCLLPLFRRRRFKSGFNNSFLGLVMGAPLGVCVNCAAPIARSLYGGGSAMQTALAALIASPTLNVVVLTMALSLFPFYVVAAKIILTLVFILVLIPLGCHFFFRKEIEDNDLNQVCEVPVTEEESDDGLHKVKGWGSAILWSVKSYVLSFLYLLKVALPLMLLAGFLGSLLSVIAPWSSVESLGNYTSVGAALVVMPILAFFGAFLPAPMSFDVILSSALLQAGVPIQYVAIFFFTLGSFSIYAFFIVWRSMSMRVALYLFACTMLLGMAIGLISSSIEKTTFHGARSFLLAGQISHDYDPIVPRSDKAYSYVEIKDQISEHKLAFSAYDAKAPQGISVEVRDYMPAVSKQDNQLFTFVSGEDVGIHQPYEISYITGMDMALAQTTLSVATGDVHQDGWPDVLLTGDMETTPNLILFANIGGQKYMRQEVPMPEGLQEVELVSLADLNADGWLDIVFAAMNGQSYVIHNKDGAFLAENMHPLYPENKGTIMSISYGDIERDGDLDIALGNWNVGPAYSNYSASQNVLLKAQDDLTYTPQMLGQSTGETLTTMFYDFNQDGYLDLYTGNDFIGSGFSDLILTGDSNGDLTPARRDALNNIPGGHSTMSVDVGDIDNDLKPDLYIAQIAFLGHYENKMHELSAKQILHTQYCKVNKYIDPETCQKETKFKYAIAAATHITDACSWLEDVTDRTKCSIHLVNYKTYCEYETESKLPQNKEDFKIASDRYTGFCDKQDDAVAERMKALNEADENVMPNKDYHLRAANWSVNNVLLHNQSTAQEIKYEDQSDARQVGYGAWSWNARFGDLDNDGWQDLYLVNGHGFLMSLATNVFYRNAGQGQFEDHTKQSGLENFTVTTAFSYIDFDNDGDLDIVNAPLDAPIQLYLNNNPKQDHSIQFELRDFASKNTYAFGAKAIISYTQDGQVMNQLGIVKSGGGSKSYDDPVLHFGLGKVEAVQGIEITWPTGQVDRIDAEFQAGKRYRIVKKSGE